MAMFTNKLRIVQRTTKQGKNTLKVQAKYVVRGVAITKMKTPNLNGTEDLLKIALPIQAGNRLIKSESNG